MTNIAPENYLKQVRAQYEDYPYPLRDPESERRIFMTPITTSLAMINHYCFEGKRDFTKGLRILIAGGGTGDAAISLGLQLEDTPSEIVYLDFSKGTTEVAKKRAEIRGLKNITWIHASLLDIPKLNLGKFDYINCCGVLHHLENPKEGMQALSSALSDDGAMELMVYAKYGRTPIYMVQDAVNIMLPRETSSPVDRIALCRKYLDALGLTHWLRYAVPIFIGDINSDEGLFDLFLHSKDRAYTVPDVYDLVESGGCTPLHFFHFSDKLGDYSYQPEKTTNDELIKKHLLSLPLKARQALGELTHGRMIKHSFYAAKSFRAQPQITDTDYIPILDIRFNKESYESITEVFSRAQVGQTVSLEGNKEIEKASAIVEKTENLSRLLQFWDGKKTAAEIVESAHKSGGNKANKVTLLNEFGAFYDSMKQFNWMVLRHKSVAPYLSSHEIQEQWQDRHTGG